MVAVLVAFLIGAFIGLAVRPLVDAYISYKTAELYRDMAKPADRHASNED